MPSQRGGFSSFSGVLNDPVALRFARGSAILAVLVVALGYVLMTGQFSAGTQMWFSNVVTILVPLTIPFTSGWAALRARGRLRLAWQLMGVAGALWLGGEILWLVENYVLLAEAVPAVSDAFYLSALIPAGAALVVFPAPLRQRAERTRLLLAALVVTAAVLFVSRSLTLSVILPSATGSWLAQAVYLAYPSADVLLASLALIGLLRMGEGARLHFVLLAAGFLLYSVADTLYARQAALDEYTAGTLLDVGWVAGYALFALAPLAPGAWHNDPRAQASRQGQRFDWSSLALYVPLLMAVVVAASIPSPQADPLLIVTGLAALVIFAFRQALLAGDHRRLRGDLESQVEQLRVASAGLRQLASQNERVVQSVVDAVIGVDADGLITFVNSRAMTMLRRTSADLLGHGESLLFVDRTDRAAPGSQRLEEAPGSHVREALTFGTVVSSATATFSRGDGSTFPGELAVGPIEEGDRITGAVVVFRDVSARIAVEKMKNEFVSVVSHELRTPLTSIRGSLGLLAAGLGGDLSPRGSRMVGIALDSSERLTRLIEDMLDIERMESGSLVLVPARCEIEPLVRTAVNEVDVMARQYGVRVVAQDLTGIVWGDADRIVQTLTNLLGNSLKFSPRGGVVTVSTRQRTDMVEFAITDHGRGIPADRISHIFKRFEQVDSSDSRERGGTGLGLAISRDLVALHGGEIWVESELGHGSTFRFTLPGSVVDDEQRSTDPVFQRDLDGVIP